MVLVLWLNRRAAFCSSQSNKQPCLPSEAPTLATTPWPEQGKILAPAGTEIKGSNDLEDGGGGSPWGTRCHLAEPVQIHTFRGISGKGLGGVVRQAGQYGPRRTKQDLKGRAEQRAKLAVARREREGAGQCPAAFLNGPWTKNGSILSTGWERIRCRILCDKRQIYKSQISVFTKKDFFTETQPTHPCTEGCFCIKAGKRPNGPQSLKYLLPAPFQKFADSPSGTSREGAADAPGPLRGFVNVVGAKG